jgi:hypothetical protein
MPVLRVEPLIGVGPVRLGMRRAESRRAIGRVPHAFRKTPSSPNTTDAYDDMGIHVYFDAEDAVEYVELFSVPYFVVTYKGVNVFETPAEDLVDLISKDAPFDPADPELGYSYIFPRLELSLWRPTLPKDRDDMEARVFSSIGVGRKGYYSTAGRI